jgi:FAD:protein FMN transferase
MVGPPADNATRRRYQEFVISASARRPAVHREAPALQRTQPWLGTLVTIQLRGVPRQQADRLFRRGFAAIAQVHRLMSFHERSSDVDRLNRLAHVRAVRVHPLTLQVLRAALRLSRDSGGVFDVTVAGQAVASGWLPAPDAARPQGLRANWRDIRLLHRQRVRFLRPLWIDLGGIAKGFAVDRAVAALDPGSRVSACVNAGGDLRVAGPAPQRIWLDAPGAPQGGRGIELRSGALASSLGLGTRSPHWHGATHRALNRPRFASVIAPTALQADALTKVVLARGPRARALLRRYRAQALLCEQKRWQHLAVRA